MKLSITECATLCIIVLILCVTYTLSGAQSLPALDEELQHKLASRDESAKVIAFRSCLNHNLINEEKPLHCNRILEEPMTPTVVKTSYTLDETTFKLIGLIHDAIDQAYYKCLDVPFARLQESEKEKENILNRQDACAQIRTILSDEEISKIISLSNKSADDEPAIDSKILIAAP